METLIDSASSKTINYAYASSVIADDEFINAASPPHQQRPMLPPPTTSQDSPSPPQLPNDVSSSVPRHVYARAKTMSNDIAFFPQTS
jgi:hypothetical protein